MTATQTSIAARDSRDAETAKALLAHTSEIDEPTADAPGKCWLFQVLAPYSDGQEPGSFLKVDEDTPGLVCATSREEMEDILVYHQGVLNLRPVRVK